MTIPQPAPPRSRPPRSISAAPAALSNRLVIVERKPDDLRPAQRRVRRAGKHQVQTIQNNIERFGLYGFVLVTEDGVIIDGHNLWQACKNLGISVPTIVVTGLTDAEIRTLRISLNRIAELSSWDEEALQSELRDLLEIDTGLSFFTGFTSAQIDTYLDQTFHVDEDEDCEGSGLPNLGRDGDIWDLPGGHVLLQGDARLPESFATLLKTERVQAVVSDIPYGCSIAGHASSTHPDFIDGSSMSSSELEELIGAYFANAGPFLADGALAYTFMDGRGLLPLLSSAKIAGHDQVAFCVWDKVNPGMGSLYRQQAEFVLVTKKGRSPHINNVLLGKNGRNRSNVWSYPGLAGFGVARSETLAMHPTVKPVGLMADILLDCTRRGDNVLDPFAGSGTIFLAAHRTKRRAFAIELDPKYIDVAIRRIEDATGQKAISRLTGSSYARTMEERAGSPARPRVRMRPASMLSAASHT